MTESERLWAEIRAMAERVAKLEARYMELTWPAPALASPTVQHSTDVRIGPGSVPRAAPTFEQLVAKLDTLGPKLPTCEKWCGELRPNVCCGDARLPFASGQLASAGEASAPTGWKLAPGWSLAPFGAVSCTHSDRDGKWDCDLDGLFENDHGACAAHAVEMGALVRDVPPSEQPKGSASCVCRIPRIGCPEMCDQDCATCRAAKSAEQPSRQETPGGEATWACRPLCGQIRTGDHSQCKAHMRLRESDSGPTCFCTQACCDRAYRNRAKAKAAEQAQSDTWASVEKNAAEVRTWPAWKQQVAKAALGAKAAEQAKRIEQKVLTFYEQAKLPGEPSGTGHVPGASVVEVVSEGPPTRSLADILRDPPKLNLSPPAPAAGTLSEAISALPEQVRRYVHEIETNCDPAGTVRDNVLLRDQLAALERRLADETNYAGRWQNEVAAIETRLAQAEKAHRDALALASSQLELIAQVERERDGAAREREDIRRALGEEESVRRRIEDACNESGRQLHEALVKLARVERQRDDWRSEATSRLNVAVTAKRERDEATAKLAGSVPRGVHVRTVQEAEAAEAQKIHDEATAKERERCLAWAENYVTDNALDDEAMMDAIREGKPAPGTDEPAPKCDPDPPGFPPELAHQGAERPAWSSQSDPPRDVPLVVPQSKGMWERNPPLPPGIIPESMSVCPPDAAPDRTQAGSVEQYEPCGASNDYGLSPPSRCILPTGHGDYHRDLDGGLW